MCRCDICIGEMADTIAEARDIASRLLPESPFDRRVIFRAGELLLLLADALD